jgi:hypothetical protein
MTLTINVFRLNDRIWGVPMDEFWTTLLLDFCSNYRTWHIQYLEMSDVEM